MRSITKNIRTRIFTGIKYIFITYSHQNAKMHGNILESLIYATKYTALFIESRGRIGAFMENLRNSVDVYRLILRARKLECVPVITGGREELAYSSARVYVVRRVARHKKKAFANPRCGTK